MKKSTKTLVILTVVLVVCVGAYIGISAYTKHQADSTLAEVDNSLLYPVELGSPAAVTYTTGSSTLSFASENSLWYWKDDQDFPLNQNKLNLISSTLVGLTALRSFEPAGPLSDYGLEQPAYTVTATSADGSTFNLRIGSQAGDNYYALADGSGTIYTIEPTLIGYLEPDIMGMLVLDSLPALTETALEKLTLDDGTWTLTLDKYKEKNGTTTWFIVEGETYTPAADYVPATTPSEDARSPKSLVKSVVSALSSAAFSSCAAWKPSDEALLLYGLNAPKLTLTVNCTTTGTAGETSDVTAVIEIGTQLPDGSGYYARIPGSSQINVLPAEAIDPLLTALSTLGITG